MLFEKGDKILFIGDSISDFDRARPVGEGLFNAWGTSYVADVGATLACAYPELGLRVVNMGISGNQVRDLLARWQSDVLDLKPDWVSVLIGINDVWRQFDCPQMPETHVSPEEYRAGYEELIQRTLPLVKGMVLMTPYFMEPNRADPCAAAWTSTARSCGSSPSGTAWSLWTCRPAGTSCSSTCTPATSRGTASTPTRSATCTSPASSSAPWAPPARRGGAGRQP